MLDTNQIALHNKFITQLFKKCVQSTRNYGPSSTLSTGNRHRPKPTAGTNKRRSRQSNGGFQVISVNKSCFYTKRQ